MCQVIISSSAEKDLDRLPAFALKKIGIAIDHLADDPRPSGCK